jgi:hypothetical protein
MQIYGLADRWNRETIMAEYFQNIFNTVITEKLLHDLACYL